MQGPRERALSEGVEGLTDHDLVALIIGRATAEVALGVLDRVGGLEGLPRAGPARLAEVPGLGVATALRLGASVEIGRRIVRRQAGARPRAAAPAEVAAWFAPRVAHLDHECMWVVALDGNNRMRGVRQVAQGGRHGLAVSAREILGAALLDAAAGFLLVHNHPSGSPAPSPEDIRMTRAVARAADVVGVPLLDHVVVTASGSYRSLLEDGVLSPPSSGSSSPSGARGQAVRSRPSG